ncbi:MAG TPA: 30S ribosome-binding factor RbfA [Oceanospirillales bacterium]|jgi:ribosome-binding factor A|uniref:30S ribosome-binding factor RbfA n=1 Tax=unclassified Thalassolituus TaxID=2624967 RepID=UPI000C0D056C|nr:MULTISPECIES: 30S ribosome-binding factor RbfA [unclassified Thalassolituus]MAE34027.1 ribosome-binding factor A [Oceanospirillaceae bacterium]MEC8908164.1 30S ribosome-binding factor RbfA [Pseudomonadota bacterium]HCG77798.1 30S ribosome-binding factor RbfA [Oceanospirillales bacterium]MBN56968.1 ribosome-binding factor A [Oceanospirillaceae bacterium]MDQ4422920.1 30S ribosome-binding factor RbfA [Thalassolituus sp.]|tara:strand:- start:647 stop:1063 length:417 start_codon:yes stop_codon:yes gene_type:complete
MPKDFSRTSRLGEQIQREVAQMIQFEMKNPNLGMVTLNSVKVAKDLGYADIYFTVMGAKGETDAEIRANTSKILNEAAGYLRSQLARILTTRVTPQLRFHYDETLERGHHLTGLIKQARAEDDARHEGDNSDQDDAQN